jgi:hypothetical protein
MFLDVIRIEGYDRLCHIENQSSFATNLAKGVHV